MRKMVRVNLTLLITMIIQHHRRIKSIFIMYYRWVLYVKCYQNILSSASDGVHTRMGLLSSVPLDTVNKSENIASVWYFSKHVETSGHLGYFVWAVWRHFKVLLCISFKFETWSPLTSIVCEITIMPFSCESPAVFCELKNFTQPSINMKVSR